MTDESGYLVEKLTLLGRAKEDEYFRKLDYEIIEKMKVSAAEEDAEVDRLDKVFAKIVVAVDFSAFSRKALFYARDVAERFGSAIIVLHVIDQKAVEVRMTERHPERPFLIDETREAHAGSAENLVREQREKAYEALQQFLPPSLAEYHIELRVLIGNPFERIVEVAESESADLIIMGTHGRTGISRWVAGSIAERVVRMAPCPVLTVKAPSEWVPNRVGKQDA